MNTPAPTEHPISVLNDFLAAAIAETNPDREELVWVRLRCSNGLIDFKPKPPARKPNPRIQNRGPIPYRKGGRHV